MGSLAGVCACAERRGTSAAPAITRQNSELIGRNCGMMGAAPPGGSLAEAVTT